MQPPQFSLCLKQAVLAVSLKLPSQDVHLLLIDYLLEAVRQLTYGNLWVAQEAT